MRVYQLECNQPEIELLLPDFYTGHLEKNDEERVRAHLKECKSCRVSLRAMAAISGKHAPVEMGPGERHYSPQLLGRYYSNPGSLDSVLIEQIKNHVGDCATCSADIKFMLDSDTDFRRLAQVGPKRFWWQSIADAVRRLFGGSS